MLNAPFLLQNHTLWLLAPRRGWLLRLALLCMLLLAWGVQAQTITTVAGSGMLGPEGVPATSIHINQPGATAVDGAGNLYIADPGNNRIRKVDASGTITTVAGNGTPDFAGDGGPASSAQLYYPTSVAVDGAGNLFIADYGNHRIRKVDASGTITTVAGNGTPGFAGDGGPASSAQLNYPYGVAVDGAGNLYIAD